MIRLLRSAPDVDGHVCRGAWHQAPDRLAPVFRSVRRNGILSTSGLSGAAIHKRIRQRAAAAGYDPVLVDQLGGHSLRAGFVTQAFRNGSDAHAIMRQTGHASPVMLEVYAREHSPWSAMPSPTSACDHHTLAAAAALPLRLGTVRGLVHRCRPAVPAGRPVDARLVLGRTSGGSGDAAGAGDSDQLAPRPRRTPGAPTASVRRVSCSGSRSRSSRPAGGRRGCSGAATPPCCCSPPQGYRCNRSPVCSAATSPATATPWSSTPAATGTGSTPPPAIRN